MLKEHKSRRILILTIVIPLLLEVFFFNFRFWESLTFEKVDGFVAADKDGVLCITGFDANVRNIFIGIGDSGETVKLMLKVTDDANTYMEYDNTEVVNYIEESKYIRFYPDGKVKEIDVVFNPYQNGVHEYDLSKAEIRLNAVRPLNFRILRFLLILAATSLIAIFRPGSKIYRVKLFDMDGKVSKRNKTAIAALFLALSSLWLYVLGSYQDFPIDEYYKRGHVEAIYSMQADALLEGHTHLDIEAPEFLAEMENPYDPYQRRVHAAEAGQGYNGDLAYYNGKYYCYYGVVPVLMFYLPFTLITGEHLPNTIPIMILGLVFIATVCAVVYLIAKKYRSVSTGHYLLLTAGMFFASFAFYCAHTPWIYSVPYIAALAFEWLAVALWMKAEDILGKSPKPHCDVKAILLLISGSVMMSLAFGSRPSAILLVILAFPIFADSIRQRRFFSAKGIINTLAVILPMLILCSLVLWFNYLRFDSFFDFGAALNLNMDIKYHEFSTGVLPYGIFEFLFQPVSINATFPFMGAPYSQFMNTIDYQGYIFINPIFGGVFAVAPVCLFSLLFVKRRKTLRSKGLFSLSLICFIEAVFILILDFEMIGIAMRYQAEFAILFALVAVIVMFDLMDENRLGDNTFKSRTIHNSAIILTLVTTVLMLMTWMPLQKYNPMAVYSPDVYYSLKYLIFVLR